MALTREDVRKIATLARLRFAPEEEERFAGQLATHRRLHRSAPELRRPGLGCRGRRGVREAADTPQPCLPRERLPGQRAGVARRLPAGAGGEGGRRCLSSGSCRPRRSPARVRSPRAVGGRGAGVLPRPHRPRRAADRRLSGGLRTAGPRPRRGDRPPRRRGGGPRTARRRAGGAQGQSQPRGARRSPAARASSPATSPPTPRPPWSACSRPAPCRRARPTWTSSPWARRARTRRSSAPATRGTSPRCRAAPAAARPRRWRRGACRSRSARTPAARSASRRRSAASSGSSPPTAGSRATAWWPSPRRLDQIGPLARNVRDAALGAAGDRRRRSARRDLRRRAGRRLPGAGIEEGHRRPARSASSARSTPRPRRRRRPQLAARRSTAGRGWAPSSSRSRCPASTPRSPSTT